jgi:hypothetical protein
MHIGFTGSQQGCRLLQSEYLNIILKAIKTKHNDVTLHHGDCIGADAECHRFARLAKYKIHSHPPDRDVKRSFCDYDRISAPQPYLIRNQRIVDESKILIAVSGTNVEIDRSGTWSTIRRARKNSDTGIIIIYLDNIRVEDSIDKIIERQEDLWKWMKVSGFLFEDQM